MVATECGEVRRGRGAGLWSALVLWRRGRTRRCGRCRSDGRVGCTRGTRRCGRGERPVRGSGPGSRTPVWTARLVRSMTGLMVTLVRESPHQALTWSSRARRWPSSMRPVGPKTVCSPTVVASKWAWTTTSRATGSPSWSFARSTLAEQVEGGLGAGEVAEGLGPADVEGLGGAECFLRRGAVDEGVVEVEGVGEVEVGLDVQGAGVVDVVLVDRDVAGVDVQVAVLGIRRRVGGGEVEAFDGLGDEPVELRGADASGDGRHLGVDPARRPRSSARERCGSWSRRRSGRARPARVRRGPVPTGGGVGGGARGRGR